MEGHCEAVLVRRRTYLQVAGLSVVALAFLAGILISVAYVGKPIVSAQSQSASAAEILAERNLFSNLSLVAQSAIVVDLDYHAVVYARNPDAQLPLASLAKVPLVLAISEVVSPDLVIGVPRDTAPSANATILKAGTRWRVRDLIAYTLVASSNDAAEILADAADEALRAKYPAPAGAAAVSRMNALAHELGLQSTYFLNSSGLDVSQTQSGAYGSARDVAKLFAYAAATLPAFFNDTALSTITITSIDGITATASNTDQVIDEVPMLIMGKTGYTDLAGGNLVVVFTAGSRTYVAAVLGSTEKGRFSDMRQLIAATESAAQSYVQP